MEWLVLIYFLILTFQNLLGIVIGPAFNIVLNFRLEFKSFNGLVFDKYTNPGFAMVFLLVVLGVMLSAFFIEPTRVRVESHNAYEEINMVVQVDLDQIDDSSFISEQNENWKTIFSRLFFKNGLWIHFVLAFVSSFILAELETALPQLTTAIYGWYVLNLKMLM